MEIRVLELLDAGKNRFEICELLGVAKTFQPDMFSRVRMKRDTIARMQREKRSSGVFTELRKARGNSDRTARPIRGLGDLARTLNTTKTDRVSEERQRSGLDNSH